MGRRKVPLTEAEKQMLTYAYELTKDERQEAVKKSRRQILSN
jgi:hypothetical protein